MERQIATIAAVTFFADAGRRGAIGTVATYRIEGGELADAKVSSGRFDNLTHPLEAQRGSGARNGSFAGQPTIRGTRTWTTADERVAIAFEHGRPDACRASHANAGALRAWSGDKSPRVPARARAPPQQRERPGGRSPDLPERVVLTSTNTNSHAASVPTFEDGSQNRAAAGSRSPAEHPEAMRARGRPWPWAPQVPHVRSARGRPLSPTHARRCPTNI
jgi:hypothetical protein